MREHIEWMEANNASVTATAEHFRITPIALIRELSLAGYEGEVLPDDDAKEPIAFREQRNNWI